MPIRVLFMQSQSYFGADSEIHSQLMQYFDRKDVTVHVACNPEESANPANTALRHLKRIPDIHLRETNFGWSFNEAPARSKIQRLKDILSIPGMLVALTIYIRKHRIQIIHCTEKPRDALYGVFLSKITRSKCVIHMHINYSPWQSRAVKWALRQAAAIVGVSKFTHDSIVAAGYAQERVHPILNSLALSSSRWKVVMDGKRMRHSMGIADSTPVLGIVSRLFSWKGHLDLIAALATVRDEYPDVLLIIVGEDDLVANGGVSFKEQLCRRIDELMLQNNVRFMGYRTDIPELMAAFDIYTMPSWEEPFGMVYLEAMAMKKPVVAWNLAGPSEIILNGQTGFLVKPKDHCALAEAICKLLRDPALRHKFGVAGRQRVEQVFNSQRLCCDVESLYNKLLGVTQESSLR